MKIKKIEKIGGLLSNPHQKFVDLFTEVQKKGGLDSLSGKLIGELYIEPGELSLQQLSERTGYSISAVSSKMKNLTRSGFVKRTKKPGTKRVYFHIEKGLIDNFLNVFDELHQNMIQMMKENVPGIIEDYEDLGARKRPKKKEKYLKTIIRSW